LEMSQNINRTSLPRSRFFIIVLYIINNWLIVESFVLNPD
jgi:hypothetical protein